MSMQFWPFCSVLWLRLNYRKDEIVRQMNQMIKNFDSELLYLRHEKTKLEIALKKAQFMYGGP